MLIYKSKFLQSKKHRLYTKDGHNKYGAVRTLHTCVNVRENQSHQLSTVLVIAIYIPSIYSYKKLQFKLRLPDVQSLQFLSLRKSMVGCTQ